MITLIAAIGANNEIGLGNKLLWHSPEDMAHFRLYTLGKPVIMGRKTYASIGNRPLPGRKCIVISTSPQDNSAVRANSVEEALSLEHCYPEMVVIGGESIYRQTIGIADKLVITHVHHTFDADTFFPKIDNRVWGEVSRADSRYQDYNFSFVEYNKKS
jgi:dihydrofolate reductase